MGGFASFLPQLIPPNKRREASGKLEDLNSPDISALLNPPGGAIENIRSGIASPLEALLQKIGLGSSGGPLDIGANATGGVGGPTGRGTPGIAPPRGGGGGAGGLAGILANIPLLLAAKNNPAIAGGFARQGNIRRDQDIELKRILAGEQASRRTARTTERGQDLSAEAEAAAEAGRLARSTEQIEAARTLAKDEAKAEAAREKVKHQRNLTELNATADVNLSNLKAIEAIRTTNKTAEIRLTADLRANDEFIRALTACKDAAGGLNEDCMNRFMLQANPELIKETARLKEVAEASKVSEQILSLKSSGADNETWRALQLEISSNEFLDNEDKANLLKQIEPLVTASETAETPGLLDAIGGITRRGILGGGLGPKQPTPNPRSPGGGRLLEAIRNLIPDVLRPPTGPQQGGPSNLIDFSNEGLRPRPRR